MLENLGILHTDESLRVIALYDKKGMDFNQIDIICIKNMWDDHAIMQFVRIKSNFNHIVKHKRGKLKFILGYKVVGKERIMLSKGGHRSCMRQESGSHDVSDDPSFKRKGWSLQEKQISWLVDWTSLKILNMLLPVVPVEFTYEMVHLLMFLIFDHPTHQIFSILTMFFTLSKNGKQQSLFQCFTNFHTRKLLNLVYEHNSYFYTYMICDVVMKEIF